MNIIKSLLSCLLAVIFVGSCSKDAVMEDLQLQLDPSFKITNNKVLKYAHAKFGNTKGNTIDIKPICKNSDTLAYVVNYGTGWELLSGDERHTPILAKGDGFYDVENLNPGQRVWLNSEMEIIQAIKNNDIIIPEQERQKNQKFWAKLQGPGSSNTKADEDPIEGWELIDIMEIRSIVNTSGHIIKTRWGQDYPWNQCVPYASGTNVRCVAGCVAVAGAQLLKFLHDSLGKPATFYTTGLCSGYQTSPSFSFDNPSSTAWSNMALTFNESYEKLYQSALLIGWVGAEVDMVYSRTESEAYSSSFKNLLSSLLISCSYNSYNANVAWEQIRSGIPVYIDAIDLNDPTIGHAWLIDGYHILTVEYRYVYEYQKHDSPFTDYGDIKYEYEYETSNYVLMNWGWGNNVDNSLYSLTDYNGWYVQGYIFKNDKNIIQLYE
ncbi:MAG: C10 family peptidase [Bacteroidales bacterium]|nr:C10 family peptidase [Bacteroidales bacterium]